MEARLVPPARFFFDYRAGSPVWTSEGPEPLDELPISQALRDELARLASWFDTSLNWDYPPDPTPWREPECQAFNQAAEAALSRLRAELGPSWRISNEHWELHEDPDLDRYLADPKGFRR